MKYQEESTIVNIPLPTIRRMPNYLRVLADFSKKGTEWISTTNFSEKLYLKPIQVRKDLAYTGVIGKPRRGYEVSVLTRAIKEMLGWDNTTEAVLVGVGALGSALLGYGGFAQHGLKIVAAFDNNPKFIGKMVHGVEVLAVEKLENLVKRTKTPIGIITVPEEAGQEIADLMVKSGVRGIWNFSPVKLRVPDYIKVQKEDLAGGLAILSVMLDK